MNAEPLRHGPAATLPARFLAWFTVDRLCRLNTVILAVLVFFVVCSNYGFAIAGTTVRWMRHPENFLTIPVLVSLLILWRERRWVVRITAREKVLALYLAFTAAGLLYSAAARAHVAEYRDVLRLLGLALALAWSVRDRRGMGIVLAGFFLGSLLNVAVAAYQYLLTDNPSMLHKVRATWQDKNIFGQQLELAIAYLTAGLFCCARRTRWAAALAAAVAVHGAALLMTLARASTLAVAAAVLVFGALHRGKAAFLAAAGIALVAGGVLLAVPARPILDRLASIRLEDQGLRERLDLIWPAVLQRIQREGILLGTGYGGNTNPERPDGTREVPITGRQVNAHNAVLQVVLVQGLVGLAFWLAFCFFAIQTAVRLMRRSGDPLHAALGGGTLLWVMIGMIRGTVSPWPFSLTIRYNLCVVALLTLAVLADNASAHAVPPSSPAAARTEPLE
ncbi:MAG: O-antigen ligase family protein [Planctomycetes bacterium]|nr:O-antigen ligase family protein [Planctomycetota bacterium]